MLRLAQTVRIARSLAALLTSPAGGGMLHDRGATQDMHQVDLESKSPPERVSSAKALQRPAAMGLTTLANESGRPIHACAHVKMTPGRELIVSAVRPSPTPISQSKRTAKQPMMAAQNTPQTVAPPKRR